jgi:hypothetical protein
MSEETSSVGISPFSEMGAIPASVFGYSVPMSPKKVDIAPEAEPVVLSAQDRNVGSHNPLIGCSYTIRMPDGIVREVFMESTEYGICGHCDRGYRYANFVKPEAMGDNFFKIKDNLIANEPVSRKIRAAIKAYDERIFLEEHPIYREKLEAEKPGRPVEIRKRLITGPENKN